MRNSSLWLQTMRLALDTRPPGARLLRGKLDMLRLVVCVAFLGLSLLPASALADGCKTGPIDRSSWSFQCDDGSDGWISWDGQLYHVYYYNGTTVTLDAAGHVVSDTGGGVV